MKRGTSGMWAVAIIGGLFAIYLFHTWGVLFAALAVGYALLVSFF